VYMISSTFLLRVDISCLRYLMSLSFGTATETKANYLGHHVKVAVITDPQGNAVLQPVEKEHLSGGIRFGKDDEQCRYLHGRRTHISFAW
ncbi:hypothetical protein MKW98_021788, partial [Papaver atlanticum]